jgi:hypothetical protein
MRKPHFSPTERQMSMMSQMWAQNVAVPELARQFGTTAFCINNLCRKRRDLFPVRKGSDALAVRDMDCVLCGSTFSSKWVRAKYCEPCRETAKNIEASTSIQSRAESRSDAIDFIQSTAGRQKTRLTDVFERPEFAWSVTFSVPYNQNVSKNARWRLGSRGVVYTTESVRKLDAEIQREVLRALDGRRLVQNKVWLSFFVEKPDHKSDAINVVDTLCDAIKKAVEVDDRWFSIRQLDWAIKKRDPHIIISIAQESNEPVITCSHCGEMKGVDLFNRNRSGPFGRARACIECKRVLDRAASEKRKARAA